MTDKIVYRCLFKTSKYGMMLHKCRHNLPSHFRIFKSFRCYIINNLANYIPSRLAALLWVAAAAFTGNDAKGAWRIWRRDRHCHASPNSAQTESACAGALGVQLAGPAYYFGEYYPKPTIGDALRPIEPQDILRANRMMYVASGFALAWGAAIRGYLV